MCIRDSSIEDGEWLQYTINVMQEGRYDLELTVSPVNEKGLVSVTDSGVPLAENLKIPITSASKRKQKLTIQNIQMERGVHHLRVYVVQGGFDFYQLFFQFKSP